ncbi:hypothetical protein [Burkholderia alba]|uniref:hypothetical protein n=1 Tax=Burkholderia alba TaxID=2683677 RepID=UPI002B0547A8|nr:hypothetical protein [Burkholderia alba]
MGSKAGAHYAQRMWRIRVGSYAPFLPPGSREASTCIRAFTEAIRFAGSGVLQGLAARRNAFAVPADDEPARTTPPGTMSPMTLASTNAGRHDRVPGADYRRPAHDRSTHAHRTGNLLSPNLTRSARERIARVHIRSAHSPPILIGSRSPGCAGSGAAASSSEGIGMFSLALIFVYRTYSPRVESTFPSNRKERIVMLWIY